MPKEIMVKAAPKMAPPHPGELLRNDVLPNLRLNGSQLAILLGVSRQHVYKILRGQQIISVEMAILLGKLCGNGPDHWLRLQQAYDLHHLSQKMSRRLAKIPALGTTVPSH